MDWSTSALMNNSPLARRLPGQRTPPDPTMAQAHAADLTYGWHTASSSSTSESSHDDSEDDDHLGEGSSTGMTKQKEAALALRRRRRQLRAGNQHAMDSSDSEGSIASYRSASGRGATGSAEQSKKNDDTDGLGGDPTAQHTAPEYDADSFICRICFDGPSSQDEGGESLGKLIAPCRCRGTMKFVHQACLTRWRAASMRQSSIMACDQCGSPYKFRKSRFVGLATNRALILLFSCLLFVTLIWTVGFTAECVVRRWDTPAVDTSTSSKSNSAKSKSTAGNGVWQYIFGDDDDVGSHPSYGDYDSDVYTYGYGYVTSVYWEPLSYIRLVKSAVKHVGSGRATKAVKQLFQDDKSDSPERVIEEAGEKDMSWHAALLNDWKYGSGGIWEGQRPGVDSADEADSTEARRSKADQDRYDARTATELKPGQKPLRSKSKSVINEPEEKSSLWERLTMQFSLGFSLVGIFSFINLLLGVSFWGPFHLGNFGLGRSFARLTGGGRGRRGGGGGGNSDGGTIASVILLFLVIIGILRALMAVISLTTYMSKRLLTRVEDYIVEYSGEEERPVPPQAQQGMPNQAGLRQWWARR